jgi:purine nucleoside phosphorylase
MPTDDEVLLARALQACYAMVCRTAGEHQWTEADEDGVTLCVSCGEVGLGPPPA